MKILITGCNGQVGFLLANLLRNDFELLALNHHDLDITDRECVLNKVSDFKPDIIINAAAYTAVDKAETEREKVFLVNSDGVRNLAEAAELGNSAIIHLSTDYVYEGNKSSPYIESDEVNPQSIYGKSKLAGEVQVINMCKKHIIIRTAWIFGEHGHNFVKTMLRLGRDKKLLNVVNDQYGGPTYAGDIADVIITISKKINSKDFINWGIYHFSGFPHVSWYDFADEIIQNAHSQGVLAARPDLKGISTENYPTPALRPANSKLDCNKIQHEFGIEPSNWFVALKDLQKYT